ncbi:SDR family NAD(P)-dependent oxidoreductase [Streptomyces pseudovenezuelae]|uniref:SDR family NAD(P)-dependent oxidoreductase n=1 Tax=Streptomyces pseudovenezuelae TaxID=67350 RepID=UPI0036ECFB6F
MTRVMITGATGSLGSAFARHLIEAGADVVCLLRPGEGPGGLEHHLHRCEVRRGDVTDLASLETALQGIDEIYHFAGIAITLNKLQSLMEEVNVTGCANLVKAATTTGVRRIVHASSISAIGYPPPGEIADENFDISRSSCVNSYMITKRAGERELLRGWRTGGPEVVIVNLSACIAPYSDRRYGWAMLIESARQGKLVAYPLGGAAFTSIEDMNFGMRAAMERGEPGARYIVSSVNLTYRELFQQVAQVVGCAPPKRAVPNSVVRAAGRVGAVVAALRKDPMRSPFLVPENAALSVNRLFYNTCRAQRELGFRPTSLHASIAEVDNWLTELEVDGLIGALGPEGRRGSALRSVADHN